VVKIRLQGQDESNKRYNNMIDCYRKIVKSEGVAGLWTGWGPNVMRNSLFNAMELAGYDQFKQSMLKFGVLNDGLPLHMISGAVRN
jgi:solute carrier family 25 uncoupling protein 8/9